MIGLSIIEQAVKVLKKGGTIIYPTETLWGIGCDATNEAAVDKVSIIKDRDLVKGYILMVDEIDMLTGYVDSFSKSIQELLSSEMPTTMVFPKCYGLPSNVIRSDGTVAFRVAKTKLCKELIRSFGKPIISTSANPSKEITAIEKSKIPASILDCADYVLNLPDGQEMSMVPSRILRIDSGGSPQRIR
ncbi:MAG TPA: Sua5/YciO/YrdC/YwlC family protein [Flavobacteriales bacterium]|nr:Sua5/YciO/YrdC/YwlC family protein [Flavobacteriales bacterium]